MKMQISKILLEAILKGINLALDDIDTSSDIYALSHGKVKNIYVTKDYIEYQELIKRFKSFDLLEDGLYRLIELSKKLNIKYEVHTTNELKEIIKYVCARDKTLDLNWIDVSDIHSMVSLFHGSPFIGDISKWDVSNVTDMRNMFCLSKFNGDISKWDVSKVRWMGTMFYYASFNQDISEWNVSNVEDMQSMFADSHFNKPIGNWDVSSVRDMSGMFSGNEVFNQNISKWDVHMVKTMNSMFSGTNFNKPLNDWYVGNVEEMAYMFNQGLFNLPLDKWDVREVKTMKKMFCGACFHLDISMWNCEALIDAEGMFDNHNNLPIEFVPKKLQHWEKKWLGLKESFDFNNINLALDDIDDNIQLQSHGIIKNEYNTKLYLELIDLFVDLGLPSGTWWAKCNLGANTETDVGDFYTWGNIEPNSTNYSWNVYKFGNKTNLIKYNEYDGLTQLLPEDDAAYLLIKIGKLHAYIPTYELCKELRLYTTAEPIINYKETGINGRLFTSKKNGKLIFIPFGGYYDCIKSEPYHYWYNKNGYIWSSTIYNWALFSAHCISMDNFSLNIGVNESLRCQGLNIRPVIKL